MKSKYKSGTVAIVGRPNVGKSTLLNLLVKFKLSAVSAKPQTTRHRILGILTGDDYQIGFFDTPGVNLKEAYELDKLLVMRSIEAIRDADLTVLMVEPKLPGDIEKKLIGEIKRQNKPSILAINKIDTVKRSDILIVIKSYGDLHQFLEIIPLSALKLDGIDALMSGIVKNLPQGAALYSEDEVTDRPERFFVAETIREAVFKSYGQEVPYSVAVEIEEFKERFEEEGNKDYIRAILYVEKDSQKAILIGRGGEKLKQIGENARKEVEMLLGRPVYLDLWVKVHPKWRKDKAFLERIGY